MKQKDISEFYDEYVQRQIKTGANERLISLYKRLLKLGLQKDSKILELGCGVGLFTKLLSKKISTGIVESVDLSSKSIAVAKILLNKKKNVFLEVADVVKYYPQHSHFDFITLMDVIEHIPLDQHDELFANLSPKCTSKTRIVINIPNPQYIAYCAVYHPESLQVIDQEVPLFPLMTHFDNHNLELVYFEKYGIWEEEDYHFMVVRKKRKFKLKHLSELRNTTEKISKKFSNKIDKIKYT